MSYLPRTSRRRPVARARWLLVLALVIAALVAFCGHPGRRQSAQRQTALPGFVPTLMARASPEVVYLLGTAWGASPERVELLRSTDDGGHFQAVTAPPGSAPSAQAPLGDLEQLSFVSPEDGFAVRPAQDDGVPGTTSVVVTEDGGESWRPATLPVEPHNLPWDKGVTLVGPVQARGGPVYEVAITCTSGTDCPRYRLYRAENWSSPWAPVASPESGSRWFNAAGSIGLSAVGDRVWLITGNGMGVVNLFGSADDGNSFRLLRANLPGNSCGLGPTSSEVVWLTCGSMMVSFYRSADAGQRFVALPVTGVGSTGDTALWPTPGPLMFFMTEPGSSGFYRSTDDGRSFEKLHGLPRAFGPNGSDVSDLSFAGPTDGLLLTSTGTLWRTLDGGTTWARVPMPG